MVTDTSDGIAATVVGSDKVLRLAPQAWVPAEDETPAEGGILVVLTIHGQETVNDPYATVEAAREDVLGILGRVLGRQRGAARVIFLAERMMVDSTIDVVPGVTVSLRRAA